MHKGATITCSIHRQRLQSSALYQIVSGACGVSWVANCNKLSPRFSVQCIPVMVSYPLGFQSDRTRTGHAHALPVSNSRYFARAQRGVVC